MIKELADEIERLPGLLGVCPDATIIPSPLLVHAVFQDEVIQFDDVGVLSSPSAYTFLLANGQTAYLVSELISSSVYTNDQVSTAPANIMAAVGVLRDGAH